MTGLIKTHNGGRGDQQGGVIGPLPVSDARIFCLDEAHFAAFRDCCTRRSAVTSINVTEGKSPRDWYSGGRSNKPEANLHKFNQKLNRARLISMQADKNIRTLELCIAILAWGGMHGSNRDHLFRRSITPWLQVAQSIRDGLLDRRQAFASFAELNRTRELVGMGPAYYTKLIYFLMPRNSSNSIGYIMDQWAGCSVNLMCQQDILRIDDTVTWISHKKSVIRRVSSRVSPLNAHEQYEQFCQVIEFIAANLGSDWTPDSVELALMSKGGARPEEWRSYVVQNRLIRLGS